MHAVRMTCAGLAAALALAGCTTGGPTSHQLSCAGGTFSGAALGGFIGNQFGGSGASNAFTTTLGAGAGALLGNNAAC